MRTKAKDCQPVASWAVLRQVTSRMSRTFVELGARLCQLGRCSGWGMAGHRVQKEGYANHWAMQCNSFHSAGPDSERVDAKPGSAGSKGWLAAHTALSFGIADRVRATKALHSARPFSLYTCRVLSIAIFIMLFHPFFHLGPAKRAPDGQEEQVITRDKRSLAGEDEPLVHVAL